MVLPDFNADGVLPPTTGDPTDPANITPYPTTPLDFGSKFGNTVDRRQILTGWLDLRRLLRAAGFGSPCCFQWVDGSFLEEVEKTRGRPPADLDAITYYWPPDVHFSGRVAAAYPILVDNAQAKSTYHVDHYFVDLSAHPAGTVDLVAYWAGLFSHRRDGVWKGILRIELGSQMDDDALAGWISAQP